MILPFLFGVGVLGAAGFFVYEEFLKPGRGKPRSEGGVNQPTLGAAPRNVNNPSLPGKGSVGMDPYAAAAAAAVRASPQILQGLGSIVDKVTAPSADPGPTWADYGPSIQTGNTFNTGVGASNPDAIAADTSSLFAGSAADGAVPVDTTPGVSAADGTYQDAIV